MNTPDEDKDNPRPRPRRVGEERGYTYRAFRAEDAPPLHELMAVTRGAWDADYNAVNKAYFLYDARYIGWLLPGDGMALGAWATAPDGSPAALVLGVARELYSRGRRFETCYGTMLSVLREHRGAGLGIGVMQCTFDAMRARGMDLFIGTFDADQAGRPTITKAVVRYDPDYRISESRSMTFWACMTDLAQIDRYEPFRGAERAALLPGVRGLLRFHPTALDLRAPARRVALAEVYREPPRDLSWAIGPGLSTPKMYSDTCDPMASGTFVFDFSPRARCFITYNVNTLARLGMPERNAGIVQLVHTGTADRVQVIRALRYVNAWLLDMGCIFTMHLDVGVVPKTSLAAAGFVPTARHVCFTAMGRREAVEALHPLVPPYFSDVY